EHVARPAGVTAAAKWPRWRPSLKCDAPVTIRRCRTADGTIGRPRHSLARLHRRRSDPMRKLTLSTCAVALAALSMIIPDISAARTRYPHYRHHHYTRHYANTYNGCDSRRHRHRVNGAIIGAIGGGLVGNAAGHGGFGGTALGAGVGALAGNEI